MLNRLKLLSFFLVNSVRRRRFEPQAEKLENFASADHVVCQAWGAGGLGGGAAIARPLGSDRCAGFHAFACLTYRFLISCKQIQKLRKY